MFDVPFVVGILEGATQALQQVTIADERVAAAAAAAQGGEGEGEASDTEDGGVSVSG